MMINWWKKLKQKRNSDIHFGRQIKSNLRKNVIKDMKFYARKIVQTENEIFITCNLKSSNNNEFI